MATTARDIVQAEARVLLEVDAAFSGMSVEQGMSAAFLAYAASDAVMLSQSGAVIKGWETMRDLFAERSADADAAGQTTLVWTPLYADIAASDDLGYTCGSSHLHGTTADGETLNARGHYVSIWRKQADGGWKWVLDSGSMQSAGE